MAERPPWNKPTIDIGNPKRTMVTAQVWSAIVAYDDHVHPARQVYLLGDRLVRISKDEEGPTKIVDWDKIGLTEFIDTITDCGVIVPDGVGGTVFKVRPTPRWIAENLLARTPQFLPGASRIARVVDVPVVGKKGSDPPILTEDGYYAAAQTYLASADGLKFDGVHRGATEADLAVDPKGAHMHQEHHDKLVTEARDYLLAVFEQFPFADSASWAHALCLMLEPFVREYIGSKPTPMYAVTAETIGTGKSLLTNAALYPACGERVSMVPWSGDEESVRKTLLSVLLQGGPAVWFDNVKGLMDSQALAAALTSANGRWDDRILGHSKMASVPIRCLWVFTGNRPKATDELTRRMVPIRLTSPQPASYSFKLPLEEGWLEENRARLVNACLTVVLDYIEGSRIGQHPETGELIKSSPQATKFMRSYRAWSSVMGGILESIGVKDFLGNLDEFTNETALQVTDDEALLAQWWDAKAPPLTRSELAALFRTGALPGMPFGTPLELPLHLAGVADSGKFDEALGYWLRDTPPSGAYRIVKHGSRSPYKWAVEKVGG